MKPKPRDAGVASRMRLQSTSGTRPERELAILLRQSRFKVLENVDSLPGKPDLVIPNHRVAIFVNGCFWHGCPKHFKPPTHNRDWWLYKIERTRARDKRKANLLRRMGWSVFSVWEHHDFETAAKRIVRGIRRTS